MTVTTVGVDWGMAALGITAMPRKAREMAVRSAELTTRYGEHAAVSNVQRESLRELFHLRRGTTPAHIGHRLEAVGLTIASGAISGLLMNCDEAGR